MRLPILAAAILSACSTPAAPGPQPALPVSAPLAAPNPPPESTAPAPSLAYELTPGDSAQRIFTNSVTEVQTVDGADLPDSVTSVRASITASVLESQEGEQVVEFRIDDLTLQIPPFPADLLESMANMVIGVSHTRSMSARGDSVALHSGDAANNFALTLLELAQVLRLPPDLPTVGSTWADCRPDFVAEDSPRTKHTTCTLEWADSHELSITLTIETEGDTTPPDLDGYPMRTIVVTSQQETLQCTYLVSLSDPLPVSVECQGNGEVRGTAKGKPFTVVRSTVRTISMAVVP